ncbi:MAG: hypothetical protein L6W00_18670 [Lentisphaeria bacterium]|nr:MAG: hypothetical protein L6W00_18670 [Lentisphaeria bacterium]
MEQTLNGRSAVLPAGTVQLLLPGDAHGIGCAPGCEFVRIFNCNVLREEFQKEFLHFAAELEIAPDDLLARGMIPPGARRKLIFEDCEALLARRGSSAGSGMHCCGLCSRSFSGFCCGSRGWRRTARRNGCSTPARRCTGRRTSVPV